MFKEFYLAKNTDILIIMSATYHFFVHLFIFQQIKTLSIDKKNLKGIYNNKHWVIHDIVYKALVL